MIGEIRQPNSNPFGKVLFPITYTKLILTFQLLLVNITSVSDIPGLLSLCKSSL